MPKKELTDLDLERKKIRHAHTYGGFGIGAGAGLTASGVFAIITGVLGGIAGGIVVGTVLPLLVAFAAVGGLLGLVIGIKLGSNPEHVESHLNKRKAKIEAREAIKGHNHEAVKEEKKVVLPTKDVLSVKNMEEKEILKLEKVAAGKENAEEGKFSTRSQLEGMLSKALGSGKEALVFEYNGQTIAGYEPWEGVGSDMTKRSMNVELFNQAVEKVLDTIFQKELKVEETKAEHKPAEIDHRVYIGEELEEKEGHEDKKEIEDKEDKTL